MAAKRLWPLGVSLGALVLLAGVAQAGEEGYWKLSGAVEYLNKGVPPKGPAKIRGGEWETTFDEVTPGKVRMTMHALNAKGVAWGGIGIEFTWSRPPAVILADQVIPASGRVVGLSNWPNSQWHKLGSVGCYLVLNQRDKDGKLTGGQLLNVFGGVKQRELRIVGGATLDIVNKTGKYGKGSKGASFYLVFTACTGAGALEVQEAYLYTWVEGPPPPPEPDKKPAAK